MENKFAPMLERIKSLKKEMKITNDELAFKANIPKGTLGKILSGETKDPKITTIISIATALNVSVNFLAYGECSKVANDNNNFSIKEQNLVKKYRALDDRGKKVIDDNLKREYGFVNPAVKEQPATLTPENEKELADFRQELEAEQKGRVALQNLEEAE